MKDRTTIGAILAGGPKREEAIRKFYHHHRGMLHRMHQRYPMLDAGQLEDAYADAVLDFMENVIAGRFKGESACSSYLYAILNRRCIDALRFQQKKAEKIHRTCEALSPLMPLPAPNAVDTLSMQESLDMVKKEMEALGSPCKEILWDADYWGYSMEEIARRYGIKNAHAARQKKYSCRLRLLKRLRALGMTSL